MSAETRNGEAPVSRAPAATQERLPGHRPAGDAAATAGTAARDPGDDTTAAGAAAPMREVTEGADPNIAVATGTTPNLAAAAHGDEPPPARHGSPLAGHDVAESSIVILRMSSEPHDDAARTGAASPPARGEPGRDAPDSPTSATPTTAESTEASAWAAGPAGAASSARLPVAGAPMPSGAPVSAAASAAAADGLAPTAPARAAHPTAPADSTDGLSPAEPTRTAAPSTAPASTRTPAAVDDAAVPQRRDPARYRILGEHGRGGLGRVSRAHDRELGRDIAIKELLARNHVSEIRFMREALITARLEHPGIVPVHEAGRWPDGTPFYAMKLVSGRPLRELIAERKTVAARLGLLQHVVAVADALAYAHDRNIIHRDLKPANVIVGDFGETIVIDWGLAKDLSAADDPFAPALAAAAAGASPGPASPGPFRTRRVDDLTAAGAVMGTPTYMAPEQARGEPVDQRADVFAIGAMLWELCALDKVPPIEPALRRALLRKNGIDPDLATILDKALAPTRAARYPHAGALAADLKAFTSGARIAARTYSLPALLAHWVRRHRAWALSALAVLALILVGSSLYIHSITAERDRADRALTQTEAAKRALSEANQTTQAAYDNLSLKNAELLLASDPSSAWDALNAYRGPNNNLAQLLRAKAAGTGVARRRTSAHKDSVVRLEPLRDGTLLSVGEDGTIATTTALGAPSIVARDGTNHDVNTFARDRDRLAYACETDAICIIDFPVRRTSKFAPRSQRAPDALALSPNGLRLAARHQDRIDLWALDHDQPTLAHSTTVPDAHRLWLLSDTQLIVTAGERAYLIDAVKGTSLTTLEIPITALAVANDSVVFGSTTGELWLFHPSSRRPPIRLSVSCEGRVNGVRLGHQARVAGYACQDGIAGLFTLDGGTRSVYRAHQDGAVLSLAISEDDRYVVFGGQRGAMTIYDTSTEEPITYRGQPTRLYTVSAPTSTFPYFASGDDDGYFRIWDPPRDTSRTILRSRLPFHDAIVLDDGTVVAVSQAPILQWWRSGASGTVDMHSNGTFALRRSPDGIHFASFGLGDEISLWRSSPITRVRTLRSGPPTNVVYLNDGETVVSSSEDGRLLRWVPGEDTPSLVAKFARPLASVQVLRHDETLIVADRSGSVWRIAPQSAAVPSQLRIGHGETISHLVASDDDRWIAVGTSDGEVVLYSTSTWQPVPVMRAGGAIHLIVFSADMTMLSVVSEDGAVHLAPHPGVASEKFEHWRRLILPARTARFSPDGKFLVITTSSAGVFFYALRAHTWSYTAVSDTDVFNGRFSRDGSRFVTVDSDGRVRLFDLSKLSD